MILHKLFLSAFEITGILALGSLGLWLLSVQRPEYKRITLLLAVLFAVFGTLAVVTE